eukprot:1920611-Amphidinium_carterae.1
MTPERVRKYSSLVMRIAYLGLDCADLLECVRHMASKMKEPREGDWTQVQRVGQFLFRHPCWLVAMYRQQAAAEFARVIVDSDHAGEPSRSTTGSSTMLGGHCLRGQST